MANDSDLVILRVIKAPRAAVWRGWAEPLQFEKWWIPAPMVCRVVQMDLVPGGGFETLMAEAGGRFSHMCRGVFWISYRSNGSFSPRF